VPAAPVPERRELVPGLRTDRVTLLPGGDDLCAVAETAADPLESQLDTGPPGERCGPELKTPLTHCLVARGQPGGTVQGPNRTV